MKIKLILSSCSFALTHFVSLNAFAGNIDPNEALGIVDVEQDKSIDPCEDKSHHQWILNFSDKTSSLALQTLAQITSSPGFRIDQIIASPPTATITFDPRRLYLEIGDPPPFLFKDHGLNSILSIEGTSLDCDLETSSINAPQPPLPGGGSVLDGNLGE